MGDCQHPDKPSQYVTSHPGWLHSEMVCRYACKQSPIQVLTILGITSVTDPDRDQGVILLSQSPTKKVVYDQPARIGHNYFYAHYD